MLPLFVLCPLFWVWCFDWTENLLILSFRLNQCERALHVLLVFSRDKAPWGSSLAQCPLTHRSHHKSSHLQQKIFLCVFFSCYSKFYTILPWSLFGLFSFSFQLHINRLCCDFPVWRLIHSMWVVRSSMAWVTSLSLLLPPTFSTPPCNSMNLSVSKQYHW